MQPNVIIQQKAQPKRGTDRVEPFVDYRQLLLLFGLIDTYQITFKEFAISRRTAAQYKREPTARSPSSRVTLFPPYEDELLRLLFGLVARLRRCGGSWRDGWAIWQHF